MIRPNRRSLNSLVIFTLALASCSGSSDHRPPTVVAGNVRSVSATATTRGPFLRLAAWWRAEAVAQVPGIVVAIENSSTAATTDADGVFRLEGNHFGPSVLHFTGTGADAQLAVTLPSGGELDLLDVDLQGSSITVATQQIHFDGPITGVDCQRGLMQVLSGELVAFRVRLQPTTSIVDADGATLPCGDLVTGPTADVQGIVDSRGFVQALAIRVDQSTRETTPTPSAAATPTVTPTP